MKENKSKAKKAEKIHKVDFDTFKKEVDQILAKHKIDKALFIIQQPSDSKNITYMSMGHINNAEHKDELIFAKAGLDLFMEIGLNPKSLNVVTGIVKDAKKLQQKNLRQLQIEEKEKKFTPAQMAELTEIRNKKNTCVKKGDYDNAAKWRDAELKFLKIK